MREIGEKFRCSSSTILQRMIFFGITRRSYSSAAKIRCKFFTHNFINPCLTPSRNLAYILGVIKGDGYVYLRKGHQHGIARLKQTRAGFAESFEIALRKIGLHPHTFTYQIKTTNFSNHPKPIFDTYASSFKFVQWYKQLSLEDIESILGDNPEFIKAFIKGFYESEGCDYIRKRQNHQVWDLKMYGKNKELIDFVEHLLIGLGFDFKRYYQPKADVHILVSAKRERNFRFIREIAPCIKNRIPMKLVVE